MDKINKTSFVIIAILILAIISIINFFDNKVSSLKTEISTQENLRTALLDTIKTYRNINGELVSTKLSLQVDLDKLNSMIGELNKSQRKLLDKVNQLNKDNTVIAAALIETNIKLDGLINDKGTVDTVNNNVTFSDSTNFIKYKFIVSNVKPLNNNINPILNIKNLTLYNEQLIEFHWSNDKKKNYPISFSVTNTNDYFKTYDINSYIIPEINKIDLKPNKWQQFTTWTKKNSKLLGTIGVSTSIGIGIGLLFL
jgi:hypothetical protein